MATRSILSQTNLLLKRLLIEFLPLLHTDSRVLLAKGNLARNVIADGINKVGASCDEVIVYETVLPKESIQRLVHIIARTRSRMWLRLQVRQRFIIL